MLFLWLLAFFAVSTKPLAADPLQITGGVFLLDIEGDLFTFTGDNFALTTIGPNGLSPVQSDGLGIYSTKDFPGRCPSGAPWGFCSEATGALVDWGFQTTGGEQLLGKGNATLDGVTATNVSFLGSMSFDAVPTPLTPNEIGDFDFIGPFSFTATIRGLQNGQELFSRQFVGSGHVNVNYEATLRPGFFGAADETITYQFDSEPVPEPGTLLLLGSGLAVALRRMRRAA
jgi:hypothetical protein